MSPFQSFANFLSKNLKFKMIKFIVVIIKEQCLRKKTNQANHKLSSWVKKNKKYNDHLGLDMKIWYAI